MKWLKHAFAVDPPGPAEPSEAQQPVVDWFCMQVAKRRMTTPGLIMLELSRPLNYIGAQAMHFMRPGVWAIVRQQSYTNYIHFAEYLEKRGSIDYLAQRIEHFESEFDRIRREGGSISEYIARHNPSAPAAGGAASEEDHASDQEADRT